MTGAAIKTPTTIVKAAPEFNPHKITAVAIASHFPHQKIYSAYAAEN